MTTLEPGAHRALGEHTGRLLINHTNCGHASNSFTSIVHFTFLKLKFACFVWALFHKMRRRPPQPRGSHCMSIQFCPIKAKFHITLIWEPIWFLLQIILTMFLRRSYDALTMRPFDQKDRHSEPQASNWSRDPPVRFWAFNSKHSSLWFFSPPLKVINWTQQTFLSWHHYNFSFSLHSMHPPKFNWWALFHKSQSKSAFLAEDNIFQIVLKRLSYPFGPKEDNPIVTIYFLIILKSFLIISFKHLKRFFERLFLCLQSLGESSLKEFEHSENFG